MSDAIAMNLPGSRLLVGWWRDLGSYEPRRLWFAHLVLHRLEVLVECQAASALDALGNALLAAVQSRPSPFDIRSLGFELHYDPDLFQRLVDNLVSRGMLTLDVAGLVSTIRTESADAPRLRQRRILHFTDGSPPYVLPLVGSACSALMPPAGWAFDVGQLDRFASHPLAWRQDNLFPADIRRFLHPADLPEPAQTEAVIVDRAEQALLAIIQTSDRLLGFPLSPEGWELQRTPALSLPITSDFAQSLLAPQTTEPWRQAWQGWCQQRSLPGSDVEACKLESIDHRLVVRAPARLIDRLRQGRSEALRGEAWLLAGTGRIRHAAVIDLA
jgi:hypothetical protein